MVEQIKKQQQKEIFLTAGIVGVLLIVLVAVFIVARSSAQTDSLAAIHEAEIFVEEPEEIIGPFTNISISGRAAYVLDVNTGEVLYEKNPRDIWPLASITKIATAITAKDVADDADLIRITAAHLGPYGDGQLIPGSHFRLDDLLDYALVSSSNDAARAIADVVGQKLPEETESSANATVRFVGHMNYLTKKLGLQDTVFFNESGLDVDEEARDPGAVGSAHDVAKLVRHALQTDSSTLEATRADSLTVRTREGNVHTVQNTNGFVGSLPNLLASKTGFTNTAGGNLVVVIDPALNQPVIIVVLGSSREGRFYDVERLSNATMEYFSTKE